MADPGYGAAVAEACAREGVRAVLPLTDLDPVLLARAAPAIEARGGPRVPAEPGGRPRLPGQVGVPPDAGATAACPRRRRGCRPTPTRPLLPYPVLVKPRLGFAARHIYRCADPGELAFFLRYTPAESVIQRALPGAEFSIDCLGDLDGRALGAVPRRMIQAKGGEQIKGETLDDPQLTELGAATVEALGLTGPSTVQCFREDGAILGITDINTRFGGAFPLPQAAGAAYPETILAIAAGERPPSRAWAPTRPAS